MAREEEDEPHEESVYANLYEAFLNPLLHITASIIGLFVCWLFWELIVKMWIPIIIILVFGIQAIAPLLHDTLSLKKKAPIISKHKES